MVNSVVTSGRARYGLKHYVLDTQDDVNYLPINGIPVGSTAFVISTSKTYMMNSKGEWISIQTGASSSGGGSSSDSGGSSSEGGNDNPSTTITDYIYYGVLENEPNSVSGLTKVSTTKQALKSNGYTYKNISTNNQRVVLAIPSSFGLVCEEILVNGFGIEFNSKTVGNYIFYYDAPSTGNYNKYIYNFEEV